MSDNSPEFSDALIAITDKVKPGHSEEEWVVAIGHVVREWREGEGLSLDDVANAIPGKSVDDVQNQELGVKYIGGEALIKIATFLGFSDSRASSYPQVFEGSSQVMAMFFKVSDFLESVPAE